MAKVEPNRNPLRGFLSLQKTPEKITLLVTLAVMIEAFELGEPLPVLAVSVALISAIEEQAKAFYGNEIEALGSNRRIRIAAALRLWGACKGIGLGR